jgi:hypothetical protein
MTLAGPAAQAQNDWSSLIGLDQARQRLGRNLPAGEGITLGQVEGQPKRYMPNITKKMFKGIHFVPRSGESAPFGHANATGRLIYGQSGLAPGVDEVHAFASQNWLTEGFLRTGSGKPPRVPKARLFNHSWIGNPGKAAIPALRRVDYQIDRRGVVMCVGVNNGKKTKVPQLLSSAYNVIAVGARGGNSSGGYTRIAGQGRCKPELIAPQSKTSFATSVVTACAARLLEAADKIAQGRDASDPAAHAARPEVIKAVLLAGASKPKDWAPAEGKPLDEHFGAGMVNLDRSLQALNSEPVENGAIKRSAGWDYRQVNAAKTRQYRFTLNQPLGASSIALTWHRKVDGTSGRFRFEKSEGWSYASGLANFDMQLIRLDANGHPATVATSASDIDNVEYIFREKLEAGRYRLNITRQPDGQPGPWPYALAWHIQRQ